MLVTKFPDGLLASAGLAGLVVLVPPIDYVSRGADAFAKSPIGTGPFKLKDWIVSGKEIVMEKNPGLLAIRVDPTSMNSS
jgi:ABC-type transport system substrate-binding protein